jgi:TolB-like protein/DNA-binding winged helix-turn-helix (wHTH) protein/Tfp pilus assembly protein PilF
MASPAHPPSVICFGQFELDAANGELRKAGVSLKMHPQPFHVLQLLAARPQQIVTRDEIRSSLWGGNTFVDFERGINSCVNQIRVVLGDDSEKPRYIETLPRRGYRFIGTVHNGNGAGVVAAKEAAASAAHSKVAVPGTRRKGFVWGTGLGLTAVLALALVLGLNTGAIRNRLLGKSVAPRIQSLAVLPLRNLSADPAQEYFSDGMTDALITELARLGCVKVTSRTSSMRYKQTNKSLSEIARELNVDGIVEGTVLRSGDRVRITAQLIYGPSDKHIWANSYERELRNTLQLQGEVANDITQRISPNVGSSAAKHPASPYPLNVEAYDDYLKGRNYVSRQTKDDVIKGKEFLERSIQRDPNYAPAFAELAFAHYLRTFVDYSPQEEAIEKSKAAALKALALDEDLAEAHCVLGLIYANHEWDWAAGEREFRRAIQSDPNSSFARSQYAFYLDTVGRRIEAVQEIDRALELDPFSPMQHSSASFVFLYARQYEPARREALRAVEIDPSFAMGHLALGSVLHAEGKSGEAFAEFLRYLNMSGQTAVAQQLESAAKKIPGPGEPLQKVASLLLKNYPEKPEMEPVWAVQIAWVYMFLGDKDNAFEWLNRACDEHSMELYTVAIDPDFDPLRPDPRYQDILRRMGLQPQI